MDVRLRAERVRIDYGARFDVLPYRETAVGLYV